MLVTAIPVFYFANLRRKPKAIRNFLVSLAVLAVLCGLVMNGSVRLENDCLNAGNTNCRDYGGRNFVYMALTGFTATAWVRAWIYYRD